MLSVSELFAQATQIFNYSSTKFKIQNFEAFFTAETPSSRSSEYFLIKNPLLSVSAPPR